MGFVEEFFVIVELQVLLELLFFGLNKLLFEEVLDVVVMEDIFLHLEFFLEFYVFFLLFFFLKFLNLQFDDLFVDFDFFKLWNPLYLLRVRQDLFILSVWGGQLCPPIGAFAFPVIFGPVNRLWVDVRFRRPGLVFCRFRPSIFISVFSVLSIAMWCVCTSRLVLPGSWCVPEFRGSTS